MSLPLSHPISSLSNNTITLKRLDKTHLKRGLHLSIIPPPLTINKWPLDHFCSRCLPPVSLLQVVGFGSRQSPRTLVRAPWSFSMKSTLPAKEDFPSCLSRPLHLIKPNPQPYTLYTVCNDLYCLSGENHAGLAEGQITPQQKCSFSFYPFQLKLCKIVGC